MKGLRLCVIALVVLLGLSLFNVGTLWNRVDHPAISFPTPPDSTRTWLILGLDDRDALPDGEDVFGGPDDAVTHADVIFLLRITPSGPKLVSLPRGLMVIEDTKMTSLSGSYTLGKQEMVDLMCRALQVPVTDMATINMRGFVKLIDELGGIQLTLPYDIRDDYSQVELSAGTHTVDGNTALALVRSRQGEIKVDGEWVQDPEASLGRARRAEEALAAITSKLSQASPWTLNQAAWQVTPEVSISRGSNPLQLLDAARDLPAPIRVTGRQATAQDRFITDESTMSALQEAGFTSCEVATDS